VGWRSNEAADPTGTVAIIIPILAVALSGITVATDVINEEYGWAAFDAVGAVLTAGEIGVARAAGSAGFRSFGFARGLAQAQYAYNFANVPIAFGRAHEAFENGDVRGGCIQTGLFALGVHGVVRSPFRIGLHADRAASGLAAARLVEEELATGLSKPISVTADELQSIQKSVRRQVEKLNRRGIGEAGAAYQAALEAGDYGVAGTITHNRIFKRLRSRTFITEAGETISINKSPIWPVGEPTRGFSYRLPDVQFGRPGGTGYRVWDFKGIKSTRVYADPFGQFADIKDWTGVTPTPLYYHWR
jgi:hypothetical protein